MQRRTRRLNNYTSVQGHLGSDVVALRGWEAFQDFGVVSRVAVAAKLLGVKDFDGAVDLVWSLRLSDPVATGFFLVYPAYQLRSDRLRDTTEGAAAVVCEVEVGVRFGVRRIRGHRAVKQNNPSSRN